MDIQTHRKVLAFSSLRSATGEACPRWPMSVSLLLLFFLALYCPMTWRFPFRCLGKSGGDTSGSAHVLSKLLVSGRILTFETEKPNVGLFVLLFCCNDFSVK